MNHDLLDKISNQVHELDCMAEFAAELGVNYLDGHDAKPGFFSMEIDKAERLIFCCVDIKRRVGELMDIVGCRNSTEADK